MKVLFFIFLFVSYISSIGQINQKELLNRILEKSGSDYINEGECTFFIKVIESDKYESKQFVKGFTFCYYDDEEIFNDKVSRFIRVNEPDSTDRNIIYKVEWVLIEKGISNEKIVKRRKIKIKKS